MFDPVVWIGLAVAFALIVFALRLFWQRNHNQQTENQQNNLRTQKDEKGNIDFVRCPVCNTPLAKTDNLSSKVFRPMDTPDQRMIVMGCPHCYPTAEPGIKRSCPVCGKTIPTDGYLVARLFNHAHNKKHVIITSCSEEQKR
ncbi:MAG: hypothetical protein IJS09_01065 [Treponema sp.]|nr:hypothetical protein [Treponema sp.]